jgi:SWI/SNF-related matrix-associated actin-dependent regulator 1 of chromatin subfamily A
MILDFNPANGLYFLRVPRDGGDPQEIMREYGLDFSVSASTAKEAVLFTPEPYAAASFGRFGTPEAYARLLPILSEIEASRALTSARHIDCPAGLELFPYQRAGIDYALRREHTLIGDEQGVGKTAQAICLANEMQARRVLVVCPAGIRYQWERKIREWRTTEGLIYSIVSSRGGVHPRAAWTVISWELARSPGIHRALMAMQFDLLILDEAHYAKNIGSLRSRSVFGYHDGRGDGGALGAAVAGGLCDRASRIVALTGTPLPNRPREAYVLARGLCWDSIDWMSEDKFGERFNPTRRGETKNERVYIDERTGRTAELQNRLRANFMVRRLDAETRPQKPAVLYDLIRVEETQAVKQALEAERLLDIDPESFEGCDATVLGQIATARRLMGEAMAPQVVAYIKTLLMGGPGKLTVFAWHISVLNLLQWELSSFGVVRVDGSDGAKAKDQKVQQFILDPEIRVILGNVLSLGTGTDGLQAVSSHALIAEPDWVPGNNAQCLARLDRTGQTKTVLGDFFVAPNSIAERILAAALRKLQVIDKTLDRRV